MKLTGEESTNIEDHRPDDTFFQNVTPPFVPPKQDVEAMKAEGHSQTDMDDATSIMNSMLTDQRTLERAWVSNQDLQSLVSQKGIYAPWRQDMIDKQVHNDNEFLLDTFKRARSVGYPIHPLQPYFDSLPSTAFEGQAGQ